MNQLLVLLNTAQKEQKELKEELGEGETIGGTLAEDLAGIGGHLDDKDEYVRRNRVQQIRLNTYMDPWELFLVVQTMIENKTISNLKKYLYFSKLVFNLL